MNIRKNRLGIVISAWVVAIVFGAGVYFFRDTLQAFAQSLFPPFQNGVQGNTPPGMSTTTSVGQKAPGSRQSGAS